MLRVSLFAVETPLSGLVDIPCAARVVCTLLNPVGLNEVMNSCGHEPGSGGESSGEVSMVRVAAWLSTVLGHRVVDLESTHKRRRSSRHGIGRAREKQRWAVSLHGKTTPEISANSAWSTSVDAQGRLSPRPAPTSAKEGGDANPASSMEFHTWSSGDCRRRSKPQPITSPRASPISCPLMKSRLQDFTVAGNGHGKGLSRRQPLSR